MPIWSRWLIITGLMLIAMGVLIAILHKWFPLGRLPGDFQWQRGNFQVYFPLASSLILSLLLTLLLNLFFRR